VSATSFQNLNLEVPVPPETENSLPLTFSTMEESRPIAPRSTVTKAFVDVLHNPSVGASRRVAMHLRSNSCMLVVFHGALQYAQTETQQKW
jgi:hypothetical protein